MFWTLVAIHAVFLTIYVYRKLSKIYSHFAEIGVPYLKPFPFLGNIAQPLLGRESFIDSALKTYNSFPNDRYYGVYQLTIPKLVIRDPDLIKKISVQDFDHFADLSTAVISSDVDPVIGRSLIALQGQDWHDKRSIVSPAFTTAKIKIMFELLTEVVEQFTEYFYKRTENDNVFEVEMKDAFTRLANDVIATTAFGLKCDSMKDKENEFYMMGKKATDLRRYNALRFYSFYIIPERLMKVLKIRWTDTNTSEYFSELILGTIKTRDTEGIIRPDLIHLMMEAKKGRLRHEESNHDQDLGGEFSAVQESHVHKTTRKDKPKLDDADIVAQAFLFFLEGFDTTATVLSFMAYELAVNPEVQKKLQAEIDRTLANCEGGGLTYEALRSMKYIDMVVSETIRKWPAQSETDRRCVKPYTIEPVNPEEKAVHLREGDFITIPIYTMQRNPVFFPNPNKFDPERFNEENKNNINPSTYIPFGAGPRACIASRFALMQIKTVFVLLLSKFDIVTTDNTQIPLKLSKQHYNMTTEKGIWVGLKRRE